MPELELSLSCCVFKAQRMDRRSWALGERAFTLCFTTCASVQELLDNGAKLHRKTLLGGPETLEMLLVTFLQRF